MPEIEVKPAATEVAVPPVVTDPPPAQTMTSTELPEELPRGQVLQIPSSAMSEIRRKERERGQKAHMKKLDDQARSLGYKSHEDMMSKIHASHARKGKGGGQPQHQANAPRAQKPETPHAQPQSRQEPKEPRVNHKSDEKINMLQRKASQERARRKQLEREVQAAKAETIIRTAAVRAGVQDVDYAVHLIRQHVRKLDQRALRSFDEERYFSETLRQSHPHLYGQTSTPATTGPSGGPEPSKGVPPVAPASGSPQTTTPPRGGLKDARTMTTEQTNARLRELGLTPPNSASMPV